jgi:hypothetical protein
MMPAHFRQRIFGIEDELPRDMVRHLERFRIDVAEQRVVDQTDEGSDAGDLLFAVWHQRDADAATVARARPLGQQARLFQTPDLGRDMRGGERHVIREFANGDALGTLAVGDTHQHDELAGRQIEFAPERVPARQQAAYALHHGVDAEPEFGIGAPRQELAARDGHRRLV